MLFNPFAMLLGLGGAAVVFLAFLAFSPRKAVMMPDGTRRLEPSDLDKLAAPLGRALMRARGRRRERLQRELEWARVAYFSPELWTILPWFAVPAGFLAGFLGWVGTGGALEDGLMVGAVAGFIGLIYPRNYLKSRLKRRQDRIFEDVLPFIAQFARVLAVERDMTTTFEKMDSIALAEEEQLRRRVRMNNLSEREAGALRARSPYSSDLWIGLRDMMSQKSKGLYRADADYANPDPLLAFAIFSDDPDIAIFIDKLRQARSNDRNMSPEQLDIDVANLQKKRVSEIQKSFAKLVAQATAYLVVFNMPLLLAACLAPIIGPLLGIFGSLA